MTRVPFVLMNFAIFFSLLPLFYIFKAVEQKCVKIGYKTLTVIALETKMFAFHLWEIILFLSVMFIWILTDNYSEKLWKYFRSSTNLCIVFLIALIFIFVIILLVIKTNTVDPELDTLLLISVWYVMAIAAFLFTKSLLTLLFNLELISTIYLFFFLIHFGNHSIHVIKYKNLISNYLITSLFVLIFFVLTVLFFSFYAGTLSFKQLKYFSRTYPFFVWLTLLISIFWKLGAPTFHFFKLEIYRLLPWKSLIFFSITSFFLSTFVLLFLYVQCFCLFNLNKTILLTIILFYNGLLLLFGFNSVYLSQFLGISAINTWALMLIFCLI